MCRNIKFFDQREAGFSLDKILRENREKRLLFTQYILFQKVVMSSIFLWRNRSQVSIQTIAIALKNKTKTMKLNNRLVSS